MESIVMFSDDVVSQSEIGERALACLSVMWDESNMHEARLEASTKLTYWLDVLEMIEYEKSFRIGICIIDVNTQF